MTTSPLAGWIVDAVVREEAYAHVEVGSVAFLYEYESTRNQQMFRARHSIGVTFACTLKPDCVLRFPDRPDPHQTAVKWVPLFP